MGTFLSRLADSPRVSPTTSAPTENSTNQQISAPHYSPLARHALPIPRLKQSTVPMNAVGPQQQPYICGSLESVASSTRRIAPELLDH